LIIVYFSHQMGENDTKFTRFCPMYGDTIAHSVDSDYIPIALIEHEKQVNLLGPKKDPVKIAIYRLEFNMNKGVKRNATGDSKQGPSHPPSYG
jgi:hypothetical protein